MATLHGILAELGIEAPHMHAGDEQEEAGQWVIDRPFAPVEGRTYDLAYGADPYGDTDGDPRPLLTRVPCDSRHFDFWFDWYPGALLAPASKSYQSSICGPSMRTRFN